LFRFADDGLVGEHARFDDVSTVFGSRAMGLASAKSLGGSASNALTTGSESASSSPSSTAMARRWSTGSSPR